MSASDRHLTGGPYSAIAPALLDAQRVLADLEEATEGQLLVRTSDLAFLLRRARQLVAACARAAIEEGL